MKVAAPCRSPFVQGAIVDRHAGQRVVVEDGPTACASAIAARGHLQEVDEEGLVVLVDRIAGERDDDGTDGLPRSEGDCAADGVVVGPGSCGPGCWRSNRRSPRELLGTEGRTVKTAPEGISASVPRPRRRRRSVIVGGPAMVELSPGRRSLAGDHRRRAGVRVDPEDARRGRRKRNNQRPSSWRS